MKNTYQGLMEWVLLGVLIRSCLTDLRATPLPIAGKLATSTSTAPNPTETRVPWFRQYANTGDASEGALFI